MRRIDVVIESESFNAVHEALRRARLGPFRASEVRIFDPSKPPEGCYRGAKFPVGVECVRLELIVRDHEVKVAIDAIRDGIEVLAEGDAEIVVGPVEESVHLRPSVWARAAAGR